MRKTFFTIFGAVALIATPLIALALGQSQADRTNQPDWSKAAKPAENTIVEIVLADDDEFDE